MEFKEGDRVAVVSWSNRVVSEDTIKRLTPKQGVLANGQRFRLNDGEILGQNKRVALMTEEMALQLKQREEGKLKVDQLMQIRSSVGSLHDLMAKSHYAGFTAEELKAIAEKMECAISGRKARLEQASKSSNQDCEKERS